jgi:hypothetical protein
MSIFLLICSYVTILYVTIATLFFIGLVFVVVFDYNGLLLIAKKSDGELYGWMQESPTKWKAIWLVATLIMSVFWPMLMIYMISKNKIKQKAKEI